MTSARVVLLLIAVLIWPLAGSAMALDHGFAAYAEVLRAVVRGSRVDYAALKADRGRLDAVVRSWASPTRAEEQAWTRQQRMAFWINAYNALTLQAIIDHYPIRGSVFSLSPRSSIRQIDGVWTALKWNVAGRTVTLDDIEHKILRPTFGDARIHFAVNCASVSCPTLAPEPYRADTLNAALDAAARRYLGSTEGVRVEGRVLRVSSIFKWYGEDFIPEYAAVVPGTRAPGERAILGAIVRFGPSEAARAARGGDRRIGFLDYDWSLNDVVR